MATHFISPESVIQEALNKLIKEQKVADHAVFNFQNPKGLRSEVAYRDSDFLEALGYCDEVKVVDEALQFLLDNGHILNDRAHYNKEKFLELRIEMKRKFKKEWGTITPVFERLLYMLSSVRRPKNILAVGVFWGNALTWTIGSSCGKGKVYDVDKIIGIDVNPEAIEMAKGNMAQLCGDTQIDLIAEDGVNFAKRIDQTFDYLYLDVGISQIEKSLNYPILRNLYDKLEDGAWVIAHDTTHPYFTKSFREYLEFVRNKDFFKESICFDIDTYGFELSIK